MKTYQILLLLGIYSIINMQVLHANDKPLWNYIFSDSTALEQLDDNQKVEKIYAWITHNIKYDVKAYQNGELFEGNGRDVLKKGRTICSGYAILFNDICEELNIKSFYVAGYSKNQDFYTGKKLFSSDHAWNAVYLNDTWYLLDLTWGSGYLYTAPTIIERLVNLAGFATINSKMKFKQYPNKAYLFPNPDSLILSHLPENPIWQLTDEITTIEAFCGITSDNQETNNESIQNNYKDTLTKIGKLTNLDQLKTTGLRAHNFNPLNYQVLIDANHQIGYEYYDMALTFSNPASKKSRLKDAEKYFSIASNQATIYKSELKTYQKTELTREKEMNKDRVKTSLKNIRQSEKAIGKNQQTIEKSTKVKSKYSRKIKQIRKINLELAYDDKIYDTDKPQNETESNETLALDLHEQYKNNQERIKLLKDSVQAMYFNDKELLLSGLNINKNSIISIVKDNIPEYEKITYLCLHTNPQYYFDIEKSREYISFNNDSIDQLKILGYDLQKLTFKTNMDNLIETNKSITAITKENKKLLMDIKKNTMNAMDEDELYLIENENLILENILISESFEESIAFISDEKKLLNEENKARKAENKRVKQFIKAEKKRYNYRKERIESEFSKLIRYNQNQLKEIKTALKTVEKELKELEGK